MQILSNQVKILESSELLAINGKENLPALL